jgi:Flp pilus assembly protein TadG
VNVVRATVLAVRRRAVAGNAQSGNAIVEFVYLAVLLMMPLVYVLITVFRVQAASYAVSSATREAGRVYATSSSIDEADGRAFAAARMVMADSNLPLETDQLRITCSTNPCLQPGSQVDVVMTYNVALPLVPRFFSDRAPASIHVTSSHLEVVDRYRTAAR